MEKVDLKKQYKPLYPTGKRAQEPHFVDVPVLQYLMVDGQGNPNESKRFQDVTGALYAVSYGLKFASKGAGRDYTVMGLEGLWWSEDPEVFALDEKDEWQWTLMIMQPQWIESEMVERVIDATVKSGKLEARLSDELRLETLEERKAGQVLHIGPYADEAPTIQGLHSFINEHGYELHGKHHEVYLSDPRRVAPENMKTVIRHPVRPK